MYEERADSKIHRAGRIKERIMLNLKKEKEVEGKHGVIKGRDWDIRQTTCIGGAMLVTGLCWGIFHLDMIGIVIVAVVSSTIAFFIGWYNKSGLKIEQLLVKYFQKNMYKNQSRSYHTRNGYIDLMNGAYRRMRAADLADKRTAKMVENREKRATSKVAPTTATK